MTDRKALLLSAQRALLGRVPQSLLEVSLAFDGTVLTIQAVFDVNATDSDREELSVVATELMADLPSGCTLQEQVVLKSGSATPPRLDHLVFLRADGAVRRA